MLWWICGMLFALFIVCVLIGNFASREKIGKNYLQKELNKRGIKEVPEACIEELVTLAKGSATAAMVSGKGKTGQAADFKMALDRTADLIEEWRRDRNGIPKLMVLHRKILEKYDVK